jgi:hypothetical protein
MADEDEVTPPVGEPARAGAVWRREGAQVLLAVAGTLAVAVVAAVVTERSWLGVAGWLAAALVVAAVLVAGAARTTAGDLGAAALAFGAVVVALPTGHRRSSGLADRVLARDLPPAGVYVAVGATGILVVVLVARALVQRRPGRGDRLMLRPVPVVAGLVVGALLAGAVAGSGGAVRDRADRMAEDAVASHRHRGDARPVDEQAGPVDPREARWQRDLPSADVVGSDLATVPGWGVVVVLGLVDHGGPERGSAVTAYSTGDGAQLWSYERSDTAVSGVVVDPEAGRALLLADRADVVLDLEDGGEVAARPRPGDLGEVLPVDSTIGAERASPRRVLVGSTAVVRVQPEEGDTSATRMLALRVATGEVLASAGARATCGYAADTTGDGPVVLEWGEDCHEPRLLRPGSDGFDTLATLDAPAAPRDDACEGSCYHARLVGTDDGLVVATTLGGVGVPDPEDVSEVVALDRDGEERWRASDSLNGGRPVSGTVAQGLVLVAAGAFGVVLAAPADGAEPGRALAGWYRLDGTDGRVVAQGPAAAETPSGEVTDDPWESGDEVDVMVDSRGQHLYSPFGSSGEVVAGVVRRVEDLQPVGSFPADVDTVTRLSGDQVLVQDGSVLTAYGDPEPAPAPGDPRARRPPPAPGG